MQEGEWTSRLLTSLRKRYPTIVAYKIHGHSYQLPGMLDSYVAFNGFSCWFEVKNLTRKIDPLQWKQALLLKDNGECSNFVRYDDVQRLIHYYSPVRESECVKTMQYRSWVELGEVFLQGLINVNTQRKD